MPIVSVADAGPSALLPAGALSTKGSEIVDASGHEVQLNAVNWFGMESSTFAPHGLDTVNYKATMAQMVSLGFNAIRLPFSLQSLNTASMPNAINYALNPDLQGLNALGVLDKIVAEAQTLGLKIILDDHRSAAGGGPNDNGLWYDSGFTASDFTNSWVSVAKHFAGNSTVIGFDLSNEPHGIATWGDGNVATDWQLAATTTGDAIQAVNPDALIIVEGVQNTAGVSASWGENLAGVAAHPVTLTLADKLVYSAHDYPTSVTGNPAFDTASNLAAIWDKEWGYIQQQNIAPVLIGEFGSKLATPGDQAWMATLVKYLAGDATAGTGLAAVSQTPVSWAYWDWNPDSGDTGGLLQSDWTTVDGTKLAAIAPAMTASAVGGDLAHFTLSLSAASATAVTLHVQTEDGTAKAGVDYTAVSEDVTIAAGATTAEISVPLLSSSAVGATDVFFLQISSAVGASIGTSQGSASLPTSIQTPTTTQPVAVTPVTVVTTPVVTTPVVTAPIVTAPLTTPVVTTPGVTAPVVTPTPTPVQVAPIPAATVSVAVAADWGSGYTGAGTVGNAGTTGLSGWEIAIDTTASITNIWNATIASHVGSRYVIDNLGYNGTIAAGGSTSFGFNATHTAGDMLAASVLKVSA